jgi:hypothetical protein
VNGGGRHNLQRPIHQRLGIRSWHQHAGVYSEVQPVELFVTREIGHRLTAQAAQGVGLLSGGHVFGQRVGIVGQQSSSVMFRPAQSVQCQQLGIQAFKTQGLEVLQRPDDVHVDMKLIAYFASAVGSRGLSGT